MKFAYVTRLLRVPSLGERKQADVVVSLTSYGRRVKDGVVCYSIYSILRQTIQPKKIILWLDEEEWNEQNLPVRVKRLKEKGVNICFSENMRSHKKLLPAIKAFPEEAIITIDDDVLYPAELIEKLVETHHAFPEDIIATHAYHPHYVNGQIEPYRQWQAAAKGTADKMHFALGVGGVLYPPHSLYLPMLDYTIAQQYAPLADDVWFWGASIAQGTDKRTTDWTFDTVSFDAIYQFLHKGSALQHTNVKGTAMTNDTQIAATMTYIRENYGVS
ncbi:MAG: glycosyltransferase [Paludibacteraceae bacterium]|nr:glycosyltransferase [Paludibacteraceae bacterium]